jgi:hypothetical protein
MSIAVEAVNDRQASDQAKKLLELLKGPLVKMAVESEGIRLSGDGHPVVHRPQREF